MSVAPPHKHLVFLGSGQVNRAIASFVLSHWWTSTNAANTFDNNNNKITFITRDPEGVFEEFIADDVSFLLASSSSSVYGRNQNPLSNLRKQISICDFSNNLLRHKLLFDSTSTSAVFCAVPLHHASSYLEAAFSCITNDEKNSLMAESQKTPPVFIMSRGISLPEPLMSNGTAAKPRGLATTYQRRDVVAPTATAAVSQKNQNNNNRPKNSHFWSAASYFLENQNSNSKKQCKIDPSNFYSLGGLLSHELFRDAAFAKHVLFSESRSQRQNAESNASSPVIPMFASEIVTPPTLLLGSASDEINSKNDENKISKKISIKKMLKEDFGLDTRTLFENDEESDLETCALVDSLIIPASLGGGITKAASQQVVSSLLASRQQQTTNATNLHTVVQKSLGNYQTTVANDAEKLVNAHLNNRRRQKFSKLDGLCSTFLSQACTVALGYAGAKNVPELGRRVVTGECETSEDAEAQLFPQDSGHGEAFHSTLEALAHLSHQLVEEPQTGNTATTSMTENSFTVVSDFISGFHSPNVCARWLLHNNHNYNNTNNNISDGDGNDDGMTSSSSSSLLQPDQPHYLLEDLQRLDEAVIKGEVESNADFLKLLKNVKAADQVQDKNGATTNIYTMPRK